MFIVLFAPPSIVLILSEFVSTILSKSCTTGCIDVNNFVVLETDTVFSIHLVVSNKELLELLKLKILASE